MSRQQVAEEFGFSIDFLNHLPTSVFPRYSVGTKIFYDRAEIVAAIKGQRASPPACLPTPTVEKRGRGRPRKKPL